MTKLTSLAVKLTAYVGTLLEVRTRCPEWDTHQNAWRHDQKEDDVTLFLLLKLAGAASATNAMLALARCGFWFEAAVLARTVYDASLSIAFMLPTPDMAAGGWPSEKQKERLRDFAAETWDNPERPFEEPRQRSQIQIKDMKAALGKFQSKSEEMNPHDAGQVALQMMRFLSDYTHMAYPRLMELLEAGHGYRLNGEQSVSTFGMSGISGALLYFAQTADSVALLLGRQLTLCYEHAKANAPGDIAEKFGKKATTVSEIQDTLSVLSSEIEAIAINDSASHKEVLRRFKGK